MNALRHNYTFIALSSTFVTLSGWYTPTQTYLYRSKHKASCLQLYDPFFPFLGSNRIMIVIRSNAVRRDFSKMTSSNYSQFLTSPSKRIFVLRLVVLYLKILDPLTSDVINGANLLNAKFDQMLHCFPLRFCIFKCRYLMSHSTKELSTKFVSHHNFYFWFPWGQRWYFKIRVDRASDSEVRRPPAR